MRFFYFLHFTSDAGHTGQFALHIPTGKIYSRTSYQGGAFTSWRRLDVGRRADGALAEAVYEATLAKSASEAARLRAAMKLTFLGDITGEIAFDGSQNVTCNLSAKAVFDKIKDLEERVKELEGEKDIIFKKQDGSS